MSRHNRCKVGPAARCRCCRARDKLGHGGRAPLPRGNGRPGGGNGAGGENGTVTVTIITIVLTLILKLFNSIRSILNGVGCSSGARGRCVTTSGLASSSGIGGVLLLKMSTHSGSGSRTDETSAVVLVSVSGTRNYVGVASFRQSS